MVAWSTTDKAANITLSGGNLTAALNTAALGGVRCDTSFAGGLLYFECLVNVVNNVQVGWANATQSLTANIGTTVNGIGADVQSNIVRFNAASLGPSEHSTSQTGTAGYSICIAANFTTKLFWVRLNSGYWNGSTTADPAAGVGGYSIATIGAGPYFPMFASPSNTASVTAFFGAADMRYPIPAGFSTLDTNVQAFEAVPKFGGAAILAPPRAAASAYKMGGIAILVPPQAAASVYKMVGYAILRPKNENAPSKSRLFAYLRM